MSKVRIEWRFAAFREMRRSPEAQRAVARRAQRIADASGAGYVVGSGLGINRARSAVITSDIASMKDNARSNTILRNIGAGRIGL